MMKSMMKSSNHENKYHIDVLSDSTPIQTYYTSASGNNGEENALFLVDLGEVVAKYHNWVAQLPRIKPFYAVKCNDDAAILQVLAQLGTGFDCASKAEIQQVLNMGVGPNRIIYANPCKQNAYIKHAAKNKVSRMTFDNEMELHKIKKLYPTAELVLRILPPDNTSVQCPLGIKFGAHPKDTYHLLEKARELDLNVIGVSFHVGSGCYDATAFSAAVETARAVFDQGALLGFNFTLLDIGGGFPGHNDGEITFEEIVAELNTSLEEHFPEESGIEIIAEPGRYFVTSACTLIVNIISKRVIARDLTSTDEVGLPVHSAPTSNEEPAFMYYVNDGVYGSFNCLLFDHAEVEGSPLRELSDNEMTFTSSVWGPTCDGLDCIVKDTLLPEMELGEQIMFKNMGAYTTSAGSNFNGMPKPTVNYYIQKKVLEDNIEALGRLPLKRSSNQNYNTMTGFTNFDQSQEHEALLCVYN